MVIFRRSVKEMHKMYLQTGMQDMTRIDGHYLLINTLEYQVHWYPLKHK